MRCYYIEDIFNSDLDNFEQALKERDLQGSVEGMYWFTVPDALLTDEQKEHKDCGPHCLALEVQKGHEKGWIKLEFLVRARSVIRCLCVGYASQELRTHMMQYLDALLKELDIAE